MRESILIRFCLHVLHHCSVRVQATMSRATANGAPAAQEEPIDDDQFKLHAQTGELFLRHSLRGRVGKKKVVTQVR